MGFELNLKTSIDLKNQNAWTYHVSTALGNKSYP